MEGVSYSMKDCNDILKEMGVEVDDMMACGGGGRSAYGVRCWPICTAAP